MTARDWLEVWRSTPEAPGYEASSLGRVRHAETGKILHQNVNQDGYRFVSVKLDGRWTSRQVGACVCAAFHGPRPPGHVADHKNRVRHVNQPWNLQWLPEKVNRQIAVHERGERRHGAKLSARDVAQIRRLYRRHDRTGHYSGRALAEAFGVATPTILAIVNERRWDPEREAEVNRRRAKYQ